MLLKAKHKTNYNSFSYDKSLDKAGVVEYEMLFTVIIFQVKTKMISKLFF